MSQGTMLLPSPGGAGHTAGTAVHPGRLAYGAAPTTRPAVRDLALALGEALDAHGPAEAPVIAARLLENLLGRPGVLAPEHRQPGASGYARHLLYADPLRRFSILSLVWVPGQGTPVHGHTAWGAVGLHHGRLEVTDYHLSTDQMPHLECHECSRTTARTGQTTGARPGLADVHRIRNLSRETAISLHVYGRDLLGDPTSLNIVLSH